MPDIEIPLVGPTYTSSSVPISSQVTRNFYLEVNNTSDDDGTVVALQPFPGMKLFSSIYNGVDRGMGTFNGVLYKISGTELFSIDSLGQATSIGTIQGNGRCSLAETPNELVIATGAGKPYTYDGTTLTQGSDVDLPDASTVTYIKSRVVYDGAGSDVVFSDLGAPLTVNSANVTSADNKPDDVIAVKAFKDQLFAFGTESITPYYNSGVGNPPYDTIQNSIQDIGLAAVHSVATNNSAMYFLGSDRNVYRIRGVQAEAIGNPAIGQEFLSYSADDIAGAYASCFTWHNQNFYYLSFPNQNSWLFNESSGWTNLAYGTSPAGEQHLLSSHTFIYGKHIVGSRLTSDAFELDFDTFTDNGATIIRQRDTVKISAKGFGFPGKTLFMDRLELVAELGVGLISGQGADPQIMMSYSDDNGQTWSTEQWESLGAMGEFDVKVEWYDLGEFSHRMFRFKVSDPVKVTLISANADVSVGV